MWELLDHLLPRFELLLVPGFQTQELGVIFWAAMMLIMAVASYFLFLHRMRFGRRLKLLHNLIDTQDKNSLAVNRRDILEKALEQDPEETGKLWREFDESLVYSADKQWLFNTLDAEHFFNSRTLAPGLTSSRLLSATPSFLTAIGVLGTFIGLTLGLADLQVNAEEVDALKSGVSSMINGAAVAFMTSVWGVLLSLLLNMGEKAVERGALSKIRKLQQHIDFLYPRLPAEQSLVQIASATDESKEALQELHERIGSRLQETVSGMSESMQQAFTDALNNVMAPAIQTLVNNASQQSTSVLETLVSDFLEGITSAGNEQGALMQGAAENVRTALGNMAQQMETLFTRLNEQQKQSREYTAATSQEFASLLEQQRQDAIQRQEQMESKFNQLLEQLSSRVAEQFEHSESAARQQAEAQQAAFQQVLDGFKTQLSEFGSTSQAQIEAMQTSAKEQQNTLGQTFDNALSGFKGVMARQLEVASERESQLEKRFSDQLEELASRQQQMLDGFNAQLSKFGSTSQAQIEAMQTSAKEQQNTLGNTFDNALSGLESVMTRQLEAAAERESQLETRFSGQLEELASRQQQLLTAVTEGTQKAQQQMAQMAEQHSQLMHELNTVIRSVESSSQYMNKSSTQLGLLSTNLKQATDVLDRRLQAVTQSLEQASEQNHTLAGQVGEQAQTLKQLQDELANATRQFEQTAQLAEQSFQAMQQHQHTFLQGVGQEFQSLGTSLRQQIESIEKQADEWLRSYSQEVRTQVSDRMEQWNETTLQFADEMRRTVSAISSIVDDLERKG